MTDVAKSPGTASPTHSAYGEGELGRKVAESDLLALWMHYESRGDDDKNRMLASSALLLGVSGALFGAAIACLTASPKQTWAAAALALVSLGFAALSMMLVGFFAGHANRNFTSSAWIWCHQKGPEAHGANRTRALSREADALLEKLHQARWNARKVWLPGSGRWLSKTGCRLRVSRVFLAFFVISALMMLPPALVLALVAGWAPGFAGILACA